MSEGTPLHGDRSAWDTTNHADEHARDIDESSLQRHLPVPPGSGYEVFYDGSAWIAVPSSGSPALALDDLTDVNVPSPNDGDALIWDDGAGEWTSGSVGGGTTINELNDIGDVSVPSPNTDDVLVWDGAQWTSGSLSASGGGHTIQDEGTPLTQRTNLNFVGAAVTVTDDAGNDATLVTITGYYEPVTNGDATDPGLIYNGGDVVMTLVEELPLAMGSVIPTAPGGRLTLTSGIPVTSGDITAATVLYFTPYMGNKIELYYAGEWTEYLFNELSLSLSGYTADKNYDIFIYNNSGTLTLESVAWTNDTTRATALTTQDGVYVKSGDSTRRYLGTIRTTSTTGQCADSANKRYCWNYYNRVNKHSWKASDWVGHNYSSSSWRYWNNDSSFKIEFVTGVLQFINIHVVGRIRSYAAMGYGYDQTSSGDGAFITNETASWIQMSGTRPPAVGVGYHYIALIEMAATGTSYFMYGHIQCQWMC